MHEDLLPSESSQQHPKIFNAHIISPNHVLTDNVMRIKEQVYFEHRKRLHTLLEANVLLNQKMMRMTYFE